MRWLLLLIFCNASFYLTAQSIIQIDTIDTEKNIFPCNKGSDFSLTKALAVIEANTIEDCRELACYHHQIGVAYHSEEKDYEQARSYYKQSLNQRKKCDSAYIWKSHNSISETYRKSANIQKALWHIRKAYETEGYKTSKDSINVLRKFAEDLRDIGEIDEAIQYANMAIQINIDSTRKAHAYNTFSTILSKKEKNTEALKQAIAYADSALLYHDNNNFTDIASAYLNKGTAYGWLGEHYEALNMYELAIKYRTDDLFKAKVLTNIAAEFNNLHKYQQAINILYESLELKKKSYKNAPFNYNYAANHENLTENYEALGNIDKALEHYQLALQNLTNNFRNQDINTNPTVKNNPYIYNKPDLLRVLDLKAQAALKIDNINLAHETYQVLDEWITELYKDLFTNQSKLIWIARAHAMYSRAIEVAMKKGDEEKAFQYAEKARAVLLWQSHSQQAALNLLSNEDREKQEDILTQIRQADLQYRDGDIDIAELRSIENEQNNLEKHFEEKYPDYAKRKYQPKTITVADVQNNILNDSTALIEYHWSDDILYIFTLTRNDIFINTSNIDTDFHQHIDRFNTTLKSSSSDLTDLTTSGYTIYQKMLVPALNHLNDNIKKLTLLPDGKLNHIPFEALVTQKVNQPFNIPYLIDDYTLNYLYSCNTYGEMTTKERGQSFLGIAPSYEKTEELDNLDNEAEVTAINKMYNGKVLLNTQATREAITQDTSGIIHIASHATQGEGEGKIYLYGDDVLTQKDIQTLSWNHVQQVILSACETGTGELKKGEGVLSLGWSFVYRGVPSVVMSQWKVDDISTKKLMLDYHKKLQEKTPADEALRQAKLDFRNNGKDAKKHPYYWAAFIHTGNPPIQQINTSGTKIWYLIPALLLIAIVTFLYRRNSQS